MEKLVIASSNEGKIKEFKEMLGEKFELLSLTDIGFSGEIEETGTTFEENAYIKAKAVYDFCGQTVLADDSGLVVPSLGGAPGVYSARYSGSKDMKANKKLLLDNLKGKDRYAYFECCLVLLGKQKKLVAFGRTEGEILTEERGENGFGYDPLFYSYDLKKCFGECENAQKNACSHRFKALDNLLKKL